MLQQAFSLSFPVLSFVFFLLSLSVANSTVYLRCSELNLTSLTPYESNVNSLFTSLVNSASVYNFNKFETSPQDDGVYGLFQCRGDLSAPNCKDCVAKAIPQLQTACPMSTGGEIQLEGCFVKYDNTSFFGAPDKVELYRRCGLPIGYNSDVLNRRDAALAYLVGGNGEYFREGDFGSIQGVAQCVQDLSLSDCQDCLAEASRRLRSECETSSWGDIYLGKCYIRYADDEGNEDITSNGNVTNNKKNTKGEKTRNTVLKWIGYGGAAFLGSAFATWTVSCTYNRINVNNKKTETNINLPEAAKEVSKASKDSKAASEEISKAAENLTELVLKAAEEKKKKKEEEKKDSKKLPESYYPYGPPVATPCPCPYYLPPYPYYPPPYNYPYSEPDKCNIM